MSTAEAQARIARLYVERNRLYGSLPKCRNVLNLGCGSGSFPKNYPVAECLIVNVDRNEDVAGYPAYGPKNKGFSGFGLASNSDGRCFNVTADIMEMHRFPCAVFDMVVCGQLFEHFETRDLEWILHETHRVLAPGGFLQLDTVTDDLGEDLDEHKQHFTLTSVHELVTRMLFRPIELYTFANGTAIWALCERMMPGPDPRT